MKTFQIEERSGAQVPTLVYPIGSKRYVVAGGGDRVCDQIERGREHTDFATGLQSQSSAERRAERREN